MAMQERYEEDSVIILEKGVNELMYMVISGTVALYVNYGKKDEYLLGLCNKGSVFGQMGLLCHAKSMYTAVAETNVEVATFSEFELDHFIKTYPDKALGIMRNTARLNQVLSVNLSMMIEEHKLDSKMLDMYKDAMMDKIDDDPNGQWYFRSI